METTTNEIVVPEHYNPNQLVSYKVINNGETTYPLVKVVDLEWELENLRYYRRLAETQGNSIRSLDNALAGWLENDESAETIVMEICEMFGFDPIKEIEFEATATITGRVRVPLSEISDFDLDSMDLTVYAESHSHEVDVDVEVDHISAV